MNRTGKSGSFALAGPSQQIVNVATGSGNAGGQQLFGAGRFYSIEDHLSSFAQNPKFQYLVNRWFVEKQEYIQQLMTVPATFAEYSLHDATHSEKIIESIERLLGPERISLLTPGDSWLILQCAYTHDFGMCVTDDEKYAFLASPAFKDEIRKQENQAVFDEVLDEMTRRSHHYPYTRSHDKVRIASDYWRKNKEKLYNSERFVNEVFGDEFSLASYYLNTVIREHFRDKHAQRSRDRLIEARQNNVERDSIPGHMREAVAQIVYRHCGSPDNILELEHRENGFSSGDVIHPRFIAALLRLGDLMDMETTRFNPYIIDGLAYITKDNIAYMLKDLSVSEILVDERAINVTSSFNTEHVRRFLTRHRGGAGAAAPDEDEVRKYISSAIKYMRDWMNYIKQNTEWVWAAWSEVAPYDFPGSIAAARKLTILLDGRAYDENDMDLRYVIDPTRAAQIIEGAGLYTNRFVFLREIIQNAIDATKLQLFRHNREAIKNETTDEIMPLHNFLCKYKDELDNNAIEVSIRFNDKMTEVEISVTDRGVGIVRTRLGAMKRIGSVNDSDFEKEISSIPDWLRPTAGFGIGMQSVFLVANRFTVLTNPWKKEKSGDDMQRRIVFNSTQLGGDITSIDSKVIEKGAVCWEKISGKEYPTGTRYPYGTRVIVKIDLENPNDIIRNLVDSPEDGSFLYRAMLANVLSRKCLGLLADTFTQELIPIHISIKGANTLTTPLRFDTVPFSDKESVFDERLACIRFYENAEGRCIYFWYDNEDRENRVCALYKFTKNTGNSETTKLYFRGIRFNNNTGAPSETVRLPGEAVRLPGFDSEVNIMSGDANDWLEVNRDSVKKDKLDDICENLKAGLRAFVAGMTELAGIVCEAGPKNAEGEANEKSPVSGHFRETLKESPEFTKMLMVHAIIDNTGGSNKVLSYLADTVEDPKRNKLEVATINEYGGKIGFSDDPITQDYLPVARFIDYEADKEKIEITLDDNDDRIKAEKDMTVPAMTEYRAVRNRYKILRTEKFRRVKAYKVNKAFGDGGDAIDGIVKIYELGDEKSFTEIDRASYKVIVNNTIEGYKKGRGIGFPVFPAPDSKWFDGAKLISLKERPPVSRKLCDDRFSSFAFAPFPSEPMEELRTSGKLEETGTGRDLVCKYMRKDEWSEYYADAIRFIKQHGSVPDNLSDEKKDEAIVKAWGEYADFLSQLITGEKARRPKATKGVTK